MIVKQALRIINCFGRLSKPKISKAENIFDLMRDKTAELKFISDTNDVRLKTNKFTTLNQILSRELSISENRSSQIATTILHGNAYSLISMTPYRFSQKIGGKVVIRDTNGVQIPYHPGNTNLKFHYSINQDVPNLTQYEIDKRTAYIFNLPSEIDEKGLIEQFGYQQVKKVKIHYCMLGLPAYAVVEFNSDRYLSERSLNRSLNIKIGQKFTRIFTQNESERLKLNRRQLVLKLVPQDETPASMLRKLSQYGRVLNLDMPMEVYKAPSVKQIKQIYKNQRNPIRINLHRKNGTIESEYYPPFVATNEGQELSQQKKQQYSRRLRYCENVDIHEESQGQILTRAKGFCIVTYSCQEEAQNCYLQLRETVKMEVFNGREHFEFDQKHRQALLRFIDNSYIQKCLDDNPTKEWKEEENKRNSPLFQSLFLSSVYEEFKYSLYHELDTLVQSKDDGSFVTSRLNYRTFLQELKLSVGQGNLNPNSKTNKYGKSFDELAEQQLYGMKLKQQSKNPRYIVNIDDYIRGQNKVPPLKQRRKDKIEVKLNELDHQEASQQPQDQQQVQMDKTKFSLFKKSQLQQLAKLNQAQAPEGKSHFSTMKSTQKLYRKKTLEQKIRSHYLYNRFVRDTINQYMGIFPTQKLQAEFYRKKPTFVNPQSLKFSDGSQFITEDEVFNVLQHSSSSAQTFYDSFIKNNQIVKSFNIDVEEKILRNLEDNQSQSLFQMLDIGIVKEQFDYSGNDFEGMVRKLNMEAEFGEEYQVVETQDKKKKIVKIAKLEPLMPVQLRQRLVGNATQFQKSKEYDQNKNQILGKYMDFLWNGEPIPDELADAFGFEKGKPIDAEKLSQQLCQQNNITKKDLQKLINIKNYTEQQINEDYSMQLKVLKAREKRAEKNASDFARDPSKIIVKDKNGKSVVSKFRQV